MSRRVLVLQNASCEHLGTLSPMFENDGFEITTLIPVEGDAMPENPSGYSAIVVLGGSSGVYENHHYLRREEKLIRDALAKEIPTLGICLGSQLLAAASGGNVYRGKKKEIGWYAVELTNNGLNDIFKGLKNNIMVFQWHGDSYDLPKDAVILAKSELYPVQAFRIGSAIGIQFHLEVSKNMVIDWMKQYDSELESVKDYIKPKALLEGFDTNAESMKEYSKILYQNFRTLIKS